MLERSERENAQLRTEKEAAEQATRDATQAAPNEPPPVDVTITLIKFKGWISQWYDYICVNEMDKEPREIQVAYLRGFFSPEMRSIVQHVLNIPDDTPLTVKQIFDAIIKYLRSKRHIVLDHLAFQQRTQKDGEDFDSFYLSLLELADNAELCVHCWDRRITTNIMAGISSDEVRTKLLALSPFPALKETVDLCHALESVDHGSLDVTSKKKVQFTKKGRLGHVRNV